MEIPRFPDTDKVSQAYTSISTVRGELTSHIQGPFHSRESQAMFDWAAASGLSEHFVMIPLYCPLCGEYGALYLVVTNGTTVWAMCDECESLWKPHRPLTVDNCIQNQSFVDSARLATSTDLERARLAHDSYCRWTRPVRGP